MFVVTVRDEDGNWFLEPSPLVGGRSCWSSTRQDARHFLTRGLAEFAARHAKFNECEWSPRSRIRVLELSLTRLSAQPGFVFTAPTRE